MNHLSLTPDLLTNADLSKYHYQQYGKKKNTSLTQEFGVHSDFYSAMGMCYGNVTTTRLGVVGM